MDREKVIKGLELCGYMEGMPQCDLCPYDGKQCWKRLKNDALALLKEQEAVVRCKDCKRGTPYMVQSEQPYEDVQHGVFCGGVWHDDDWFCADGERKE